MFMEGANNFGRLCMKQIGSHFSALSFFIRETLPLYLSWMLKDRQHFKCTHFSAFFQRLLLSHCQKTEVSGNKWWNELFKIKYSSIQLYFMKVIFFLFLISVYQNSEIGGFFKCILKLRKGHGDKRRELSPSLLHSEWVWHYMIQNINTVCSFYICFCWIV